MHTVKVVARFDGHYGNKHRAEGSSFVYQSDAPITAANLPRWMAPVEPFAAPEEEGEATLADVLETLDHGDDAHWNSEGNPDLNYLKERMGRNVKREEVVAAAPELVRAKPQ